MSKALRSGAIGLVRFVNKGVCNGESTADPLACFGIGSVPSYHIAHPILRIYLCTLSAESTAFLPLLWKSAPRQWSEVAKRELADQDRRRSIKSAIAVFAYDLICDGFARYRTKSEEYPLSWHCMPSGRGAASERSASSTQHIRRPAPNCVPIPPLYFSTHELRSWR